MSGLLDLLAQNFPSLFGAPAPVRPRSLLDTTATNPVGTSSIYPPQVMTNPDPNVSPVVDRATMTPQALWGALLAGNKRYVTAADLPALENKANTAVDYGMAVAGATQPIRAFHGSPHTFDRFDLSKIGTGEGAQAYGHGLYFAGNEAVAKGYRDRLAAGVTPTIDGGPLAAQSTAFDWLKGYTNVDDAAKAIRAQIDGLTGNGPPSAFDHLLTGEKRAEYLRQLQEAADFIQSNKGRIAFQESPGSMYEVSLRTTPERLLDWDKPLSAPNNRALLQALEDTGKPVMPGDNASGGYWTLSERLRPRGAPDIAGVTAANDALRNAGLDGIQYLDAGSRAAGDGSRNYVLFRDDIIDILRRYGLLGMVGGGAGAGLLGAPEQ